MCFLKVPQKQNISQSLAAQNKQAAFILKGRGRERRGSAVLQSHLHPLPLNKDTHTDTQALT